MTERIKRIYDDWKENYDKIPITVEKMRLVTESLKAHNGYNDVIANAWALEHYLDNRTIFIEEDQLLVGNMGAKPHSAEFKPFGPAWPDDDFDKFLNDGLTITPEDRKYLRDCDDFWLNTGRSYAAKEGFYYDDDHFEFRKRGLHMPPFKSRESGIGSYAVGAPWSMFITNGLTCPDYRMFIKTGFSSYIERAKKLKAELRFRHVEDIEKYEFYEATIVSCEALLRHANRYADLCDQKAAECSDEKRAMELRQMGANCRKVLATGAETFWEALQAQTFYWCMFASGTTPFGRFDEYMWPFLKKDFEKGRITKEEAMELIQCFRLKVSDYVHISGVPTRRESWAGRARWNNMVIGGCDKDGNDITNPLTYMLIDAAKDLHLAHPTMTLRVNDNTPAELMRACLECVREGVGYPAFISEKEYIAYITENSDIPLEEARDFALNGCMDIALPGRSRQTGVPLMPVPFILEMAMDGGEDLLKQTKNGFPCKKLSEVNSYEEFYNDCFIPNMEKVINRGHEILIVRYAAFRQHCQDVLRTAFFENALEDCKDIHWKPMSFETAGGLSVVGMATTIDSLAAIKYVCFDKKLATPEELYNAMRSNWEGEDGERIRKYCLEAPKYGNGDDYVDDIGEKLWNDIRDEIRKYKGTYGNPILISAVSITTHGPAGKLTAATPDGRHSGENLSDASISPSQGKDTNGPTAVLRSGMRMAKGWSSTLHNMKFTKEALKTNEDLDKLGALVKMYLTNGGHQIQFNVVDDETLKAAQKDPQNYSDLIVRVAGYSTYFTILTPALQNDVINRTSQKQI